MVREVHFFECADCEQQYGSMSEAQSCEFDHEYESDHDNDSCELHYVLGPDVESTAVVKVDGNVAHGYDKYVSNYPVTLFQHGLDDWRITPPKDAA